MICFEVSINGSKRCIAGVGQFGVLGASINWYERIHEEVVSVDRSYNGEFLVTCMVDSDPWHSEYVKWLGELVELKAGDEFLVRVIEADSPDPPLQRGWNLSPEAEQRAKEGRRQIYEKLKRDFEDS